MLKGLIVGFSLVIGVFAASPAQAMRMDTEVEWRCTTAYVSVDGWTYPAGTYCTSFVTFNNVYEPSGNDLQYWDYAYAGGGAFRYKAYKTIPDYPNTTRATCTMDTDTRWLHAREDVSKENLKRQATGQGMFPVGTLVRVTYDDGGSEVWPVVAVTTQSPIAMEPMGGTLKCPNG